MKKMLQLLGNPRPTLDRGQALHPSPRFGFINREGSPAFVVQEIGETKPSTLRSQLHHLIIRVPERN